MQELSAGILALAEEKNVSSIDPLSAFMNTNPPDGWKDLLERIISGISSGNHPNAEGHRVIAALFADALAAFPPLPPTGVRVLNPDDALKKNVQWDENYESDFSHFVIEFAFEPHPVTAPDHQRQSFYLHPLPLPAAAVLPPADGGPRPAQQRLHDGVFGPGRTSTPRQNRIGSSAKIPAAVKGRNDEQ